MTKSNVKKLFFILSCNLFLAFGLTGEALALDTQDPVVSLVRLPQYLNKKDFEISYTALDAGESGLKQVILEYKKEGESWKGAGTYTDLSKKVKIDGSKITSDAKYYFKATAFDNSGNSSSDETSVTIDTSSPPKPENFSKSKTGVQSYKIKWHNPNSDDVYEVYIYRSDFQEFTADSGSQVAAVGVSKNTDSEWTDAVVPDSSKTYYYVLRSVDRAGNASDIVGDIKTTTVYETKEVSGESVSGQEGVAGQEPFLGTGTGSSGSSGTSGTVLGEEVVKEATGGAEVATDAAGQVVEYSKTSVMDNISKGIKQNSWWLWSLGGLALFGSLYLLLKKK